MRRTNLADDMCVLSSNGSYPIGEGSATQGGDVSIAAGTAIGGDGGNLYLRSGTFSYLNSFLKMACF